MCVHVHVYVYEYVCTCVRVHVGTVCWDPRRSEEVICRDTTVRERKRLRVRVENRWTEGTNGETVLQETSQCFTVGFVVEVTCQRSRNWDRPYIVATSVEELHNINGKT